MNLKISWKMLSKIYKFVNLIKICSINLILIFYALNCFK